MPKKPIRVVSMSFTGPKGLFTPKFLEQVGALPLDGDHYRKTMELLISTNKPLLDSIKATNPDYKNFLFIGCGVQSNRAENQHAEKTLCSPFGAAMTIEQYLGFKLKPFLLADIDRAEHVGTAYKRAFSGDQQALHADWADPSPLEIVYAQMHYMAKKFPNKPIAFERYGLDGGDCRALAVFFLQFRAMIPSNITLALNPKGSGEHPIIIQGTGFIDENYRATVRKMDALLRGAQEPGSIGKPTNYTCIIPSLLPHRAYDPSPLSVWSIGASGSSSTEVTAPSPTGLPSVTKPRSFSWPTRSPSSCSAVSAVSVSCSPSRRGSFSSGSSGSSCSTPSSRRGTLGGSPGDSAAAMPRKGLPSIRVPSTTDLGELASARSDSGTPLPAILNTPKSRGFWRHLQDTPTPTLPALCTTIPEDDDIASHRDLSSPSSSGG